MLFAVSGIFATCKKSNTEPSELSKLPPATQIGANTFGCLVNGKAYIPKGYDGTGRSNPKILLDMGFSGLPYLQIEANQFDKYNEGEGSIIINIAEIKGAGSYTGLNFDFFANCPKIIENCYTEPFNNRIIKFGEAFITGFSNNLISGTFKAKFKAPNCDTVYITEGRFDFKL